jgi:hypothetical protein
MRIMRNRVYTLDAMRTVYWKSETVASEVEVARKAQ